MPVVGCVCVLVAVVVVVGGDLASSKVDFNFFGKKIKRSVSCSIRDLITPRNKWRFAFVRNYLILCDRHYFLREGRRVCGWEGVGSKDSWCVVMGGCVREKGSQHTHCGAKS